MAVRSGIAFDERNYFGMRLEPALTRNHLSRHSQGMPDLH